MPNEARIKIESLKFREKPADELKVYVIRYHKTDKSTVFWFNNNCIQIIFEDFSELLLSENRVITYVNKYGDRSYFYEKDKDCQPEEIKKRLLYFYSMVQSRLLKKNTQ